MNIYVGNISRTATEQDLKDAFAAFGEVSSSSIIKDKFTRREPRFRLRRDAEQGRGRQGHFRTERQGPQGPSADGQRGPAPDRSSPHGRRRWRQGRLRRRPRPVLIALGTCNQFLLKLVRVPDLID